MCANGLQAIQPVANFIIIQLHKYSPVVFGYNKKHIITHLKSKDYTTNTSIYSIQIILKSVKEH